MSRLFQVGVCCAWFWGNFCWADPSHKTTIIVNQRLRGSQVKPKAKTLKSGDFLVMWMIYEGEKPGYYGRRLSSDGRFSSNELRLTREDYELQELRPIDVSSIVLDSRIVDVNDAFILETPFGPWIAFSGVGEGKVDSDIFLYASFLDSQKRRDEIENAILLFQNKVMETDLKAVEDLGIVIRGRLDFVNGLSVSGTPSALQDLQWNNRIVGIFKDDAVQKSLSFSVDQIDADKLAEKYNLTGVGVKVCILDTGIDNDHPFFPSGLTQFNFIDGTTNAEDDEGHGTHVAGIVASRDSVYRGVAPDATLLIGKVLGADGLGSYSNLILTSFSIGGPEIDLVAPGSFISSAKMGGGVVAKSGTSMATPHVTGLAALVLQHAPDFDPSLIKLTMQRGAKDLDQAGFDEKTGWGRIDGEDTIELIKLRNGTSYISGANLTKPTILALGLSLFTAMLLAI